MDKRWIYILIIFIIGVACLYFIVDSSTTVGKANIYLNTFTITVPSEYNIEDSGETQLQIVNKKTKERIIIKDLTKKKDIHTEMQDRLDALNANENITLIKNTTIVNKNQTYPSIYYEKVTGTINRMTFFNNYKHGFSIECSNFHDNRTIEEHTLFIIDNLRPDYKQKQS